MNPLIAKAGWVDVTDDESISFFTIVTLSFLMLSIMIDESNQLDLILSIGILRFYKNGNSGKSFFRNICIKRRYFI